MGSADSPMHLTIDGAIVTFASINAGLALADAPIDINDQSLTGVDDLEVGGDADITGDITAGGGFVREVGPYHVTLAANQTDTPLNYGNSAGAYVTRRPGSITGISAILSDAITGASKTVTLQLFLDGDVKAQFDLVFTTGGAETLLYEIVAKDTVTFTAGQTIDLGYTSNGITNTPDITATVELEC